VSSLLPVTVYAFIFHHSVPVLSQPMADTRRLSLMFTVAFAGIFASYVSIGLAVGGFFGGSVASSCNLEWSGYVGCMAAPSGYVAATGLGSLLTDVLPPRPVLGAAAAACNSSATWAAECTDVAARPWWATVIAFIVVTFPAVDVLSAYPLKAITLGNNLMGAVFGEAALSSPEADEGDQGDLSSAGGSGIAPFSSSSSSRTREVDEKRGLLSGDHSSLPLLVPNATGLVACKDATAASQAKVVRAVVQEDRRRLSKSSDDLRAEPASPPHAKSFRRPEAHVLTVAAAARETGFVAQPGADDGGLTAARELSSSSFARLSGGGSGAPLPLAGDAPRRRKFATDAAAGGDAITHDEEAAAVDLSVTVGSGSCARDSGLPLLGATAHGGSFPASAAAERPWAVRTRRRFRCTQIAFRVLAAAPPIVGAAFVRDLGVILKWTGILGVLVVIAVPALLQLRALAVLRDACLRVSVRLWGVAAAAPQVTGGTGNAPSPGTTATVACTPAAAWAADHKQLLRAAAAGLEAVAPAAAATPAAAAPASGLGEVQAACAQAIAASTRGGTPWQETFLRAPAVDALLPSPYASWAAWRPGRIPEAVLVLAAALVVGIAVEVARATLTAAH